MEITLKANGHSIIKIENKNLNHFKKHVEKLIKEFGGKYIRKSTRYTYYEIYEDILNKKEVI